MHHALQFAAHPNQVQVPHFRSLPRWQSTWTELLLTRMGLRRRRDLRIQLHQLAWTLRSLFSRLQALLNSSTSRGTDSVAAEFEEDLLTVQLAEAFWTVRVSEQRLEAELNIQIMREKLEVERKLPQIFVRDRRFVVVLSSSSNSRVRSPVPFIAPFSMNAGVPGVVRQ
ncbi:hypothetical protein [Pseudomonas sp. WCS374]|uniref:hypothetical protein n=1 Tax=Pseudomonas sp. WCS374 TaxID=1495331 RepID=UPI0012DFDBDA|nr:hypothetical protein [Pseudomonas sp. WCS374]